jgi:4-amino-4-deoxy-L-arabinose transferase-like glycosyltransferase
MPGEGAPSYRWFAYALAAVAVLGLAVRVAYVLLEQRDIDFGGDARFYHEGANLLADGKGFISPFEYQQGHVVEAADHPPLYIVFLAVPSALRMTSTLTHLLWSCALGTATIVLIGLLGRALVNERVGIIAAAVLAVLPDAWMSDGSLLAETAALFTATLAVLLAYGCWRQPSWRRFAAVGAATGATALARSELVLLVVALVVPLAFLAGSADLRQRLRWLGVGVLAALVVMGPWVGYNLVRFRRPVLLSSQFGPLLASANCDTTYYGRLLGFFSIPCDRDIAEREIEPGLDQSERDSIYRREALEYVRGHAGRVPVVMAARAGRVLGVFRPNQQVQIDSFLNQYGVGFVRAGLYSFQAVAILAVIGAVLLRRRRTAPLFPVLATPAVVLVTVFVTYGLTRFRFAAETSLIVLAAVAIDAAVVRLAVRSRARPGTTGEPAR